MQHKIIDTEQVALLIDDQVEEEKHGQNYFDFGALLPEIKMMIMGYLSLNDIGNLAQTSQSNANLITSKRFHLTNYKYQVCMDFDEVDEHDRVRRRTGYVSGSYAQLRAFFSDREQLIQRISEIESSCYMSDHRSYNNENTRKAAAISGISGMVSCILLGCASFGSVHVTQSAIEIGACGTFSGLSWLICAANTIAICTSQHIQRVRTERSMEYVVAHRDLGAVPGPANLHGSLFRWQDAEDHQDYIPAKLAMNE